MPKAHRYPEGQVLGKEPENNSFRLEEEVERRGGGQCRRQGGQMRQRGFRWASPGSPASSVQGKSQIWGGWGVDGTAALAWNSLAHELCQQGPSPPTPQPLCSFIS